MVGVLEISAPVRDGVKGILDASCESLYKGSDDRSHPSRLITSGRVVARSADRATSADRRSPAFGPEETSGRGRWHGQQTVPHLLADETRTTFLEHET